MAATKSLIFTLLAVTLAAVAVSSTPYYSSYNGNHYAAPNKSHNLIIGNRQPGDRLMYQETIAKPSKALRVVEVVKSLGIPKNYFLTQVRAMDQKTNGNGAIASRLAGGIGYNNITLKFKSMRSHGINFVVQLYGKPRW